MDVSNMELRDIVCVILGYAARVAWVGGFMFSGLIALLWYFQEKLLFYPTVPEGYETPDKNLAGFRSPKERGMDFEDVTLIASDGIKLHAWLVKQRVNYSSAPTIIFFHGNAGNVGFRLPNIELMYQKCGVNILAVSYRGYGWSEGKPTEYGVYRDAEAALDFLLKRDDIDNRRIYAFGRSIGGAVAIELAVRRPTALRGLIVENTFTSLRDMIPLVFPFFRPFRPILNLVQRVHMDNRLKVPHIEIPILFICGEKDMLVPMGHMRSLFEASPSKLKTMFAVKDGGHNDSWEKGGERYYMQLSSFIKSSSTIIGLQGGSNEVEDKNKNKTAIDNNNNNNVAAGKSVETTTRRRPNAPAAADEL